MHFKWSAFKLILVQTGRGALCALAAFFFATIGLAESIGQLQNLNLKSCSRALCYELITDQGVQPALDKMIAFDSAALKVWHDKKLITTIRGADGYYHLGGNTLVMRGIKNRYYRELELNLNTGGVETFP